MKTSSHTSHSQQLGLSMLGNSSQTGVPPTNRGYLLATVPHFAHLDGMRVSKCSIANCLQYIAHSVQHCMDCPYYTSWHLVSIPLSAPSEKCHAWFLTKSYRREKAWEWVQLTMYMYVWSTVSKLIPHRHHLLHQDNVMTEVCSQRHRLLFQLYNIFPFIIREIFILYT